tara:strand:+ start:744 stop:995 length:252 start_codon:yes stop_codon:yes gene_type:complete
MDIGVKMSLTNQQLDTICEHFAETIVAGMSEQQMEQYIYERIFKRLIRYGEEDLLNQIADRYGEQMVEDLIRLVSKRDEYYNP